MPRNLRDKLVLKRRELSNHLDLWTRRDPNTTSSFHRNLDRGPAMKQRLITPASNNSLITNFSEFRNMSLAKSFILLEFSK